MTLVDAYNLWSWRYSAYILSVFMVDTTVHCTRVDSEEVHRQRVRQTQRECFRGQPCHRVFQPSYHFEVRKQAPKNKLPLRLKLSTGHIISSSCSRQLILICEFFQNRSLVVVKHGNSGLAYIQHQNGGIVVDPLGS